MVRANSSDCAGEAGVLSGAKHGPADAVGASREPLKCLREIGGATTGHQLRRPGEVLGNQGHGFEVAVGYRLKDSRLTTRPHSLLQQAADLGHNRGRNQQLPTSKAQAGEQINTSTVVSVGAHRGRDQNRSGSRTGRAEAPGQDLVRPAVLVDPIPKNAGGQGRSPPADDTRTPRLRPHTRDLVIGQRIDEFVQLVAISGHDTSRRAAHPQPIRPAPGHHRPLPMVAALKDDD